MHFQLLRGQLSRTEEGDVVGDDIYMHWDHHANCGTFGALSKSSFERFWQESEEVIVNI